MIECRRTRAACRQMGGKQGETGSKRDEVCFYRLYRGSGVEGTFADEEKEEEKENLLKPAAGLPFILTVKTLPRVDVGRALVPFDITDPTTPLWLQGSTSCSPTSSRISSLDPWSSLSST